MTSNSKRPRSGRPGTRPAKAGREEPALNDSDIADLLEHAAGDPDAAHAMLMRALAGFQDIGVQMGQLAARIDKGEVVSIPGVSEAQQTSREAISTILHALRKAAH